MYQVELNRLNAETLALLLLHLTKHIYIPSLFIRIFDITQVIDNTVEDCLLYNHLVMKNKYQKVENFLKHTL